MKTKNEIRNTTADVRANPIEGLLTALPGGIEASEARGQAELVRSEVLPSDITAKDRDVLAAWGVVLGAPVENDTLFVHATIPAGWEKRRTDHAMWSDLVDDRGRVRASIFYKAAFYDRKAHLSVTTRYRVEVEYPDGPGYRTKRAHVKDGKGDTLFSMDWMTDSDEDIRAFRDNARTAAVAWLDEHRPGWQDPTQHWDTP
jgi:hypothetical protein